MFQLLCQRVALGLAACFFTVMAGAQQALVIKPLAEKKVSELPPGELFWRIENFQSLAQANAAMSTWSLVVQAEAGHGADMAMQVSSSGSTDLYALVMFVVDAAKPFSTPATIP